MEESSPKDAVLRWKREESSKGAVSGPKMEKSSQSAAEPHKTDEKLLLYPSESVVHQPFRAALRDEWVLEHRAPTGNEEWVLDTSVEAHHTSNSNLRLMHGDGQKPRDFSRGSVNTERFKVPGVQYHPGEETTNVISVSQLTLEHNVDVVFEPTCCYVRDLATEKHVGRGSLRNGVYVLDSLLINQPQDVVDAILPPGTSAQELLQDAGSEQQLDWQTYNLFGKPRMDRDKDLAAVGFVSLLSPNQERDIDLRKFFMDSCACHHVTRAGDVLKAYHADLHMQQPIQSVRTTGIGLLGHTSGPVSVCGIGYIDCAGGSLDRVLFVPESDHNLVSVSQLTEDYSVRVVFRRYVFWVDKLETKEIIGNGHRDVFGYYVVARLDVGAASDWVLDSSARHHHTPEKWLLYDLQEKAEENLPPAGEDKTDQRQICGSARTERFKVPGIRYIKGNTRNVISVAQLAYDHGLVTVYEPTCCHVKDEVTGRVVGKGSLRDSGAYVLDYLLIRQARVQEVVDASLLPVRGREADMFGQPRFNSRPMLNSIFGVPPTFPHKEARTRAFYMDSGACHHMTWNEDVLKDYHADLKPPLQSVTGVVPNYPPLKVSGIGYIDSKGGSLDGVLLVPESPANLVSVSQLTKDYSVRVVFHQDLFMIEKLGTGEMIGHGHRDGIKYVVARLDVGAASWVLDSFALLHHTPNREMLYDFQEEATTNDLPSAGADQLQILGHGSVGTKWLQVPNVRYIAGDTRNVISVARLASDHSLVTVFGPRLCYVKHEETGQIVGHGRRLCDDTYVLYSLGVSQDKVAVGGGGGGKGGGGGSSYEQEGGAGGGTGGGGGGGGGGRGEGKEEENDDDEVEEENDDDDDEEEEENDDDDDEEEEEEEEENNPDDGSSSERHIEVVRILFPPPSGQYDRDVYFVHSGVGRHATPDNDLLRAYMEITDGMSRDQMIQCFLLGTVGMAPLHVAGMGNIATGMIELDNVLHVLELGGNFVSVGQLTEQLQTQVRDRLLIHERHLRIENMNAQGQWIDGFARPLGGMGVLWLLIEELVRQIQDLNVQQANVDSLAVQIQNMRVPHVWIRAVASRVVALNNTKEQARINWLRTMLERMGWRQLRSDDLRDCLQSMGMPDAEIMFLIQYLQSLGDPQVQIDEFARRLRALEVPQPLVEELARQLQTFCGEPDPWVDEILEKIECIVPLGTRDFQITAGNFVVVGHGAKANDGLYHLRELRPCPPVRLSFCRDDPSNSHIWALRLRD